jgi:hypothetical protein
MRYQRASIGLLGLALAFGLGWTLSGRAGQQDKDDEPGVTPAVKGWTKGKGWGWVWGKDDEVGALNAMTPESIAAALRVAKTGKVYDLGVPYDRNSFRWPGHNPGEVILFRGPEGVKRQGDFIWLGMSATG